MWSASMSSQNSHSVQKEACATLIRWRFLRRQSCRVARRNSATALRLATWKDHLNNGGLQSPLWIRRRPGEETESEELAVVVVAFVEGWMVLLEMAVEAVDGLGTCAFCVDVDVAFCGRPLFRSGATGEVSMSLIKGVKAEVW
ncbi:hypothetical protein TNCV_2804721 [Trichonephila clavipes]|nr:hypothetical protein TNCV_2804721 [Trichonephila clavipes]